MAGDLLNILFNFPKERKQRFVLNDQHSKWSNISARVPLGSALEPLPFIILKNLSPNFKEIMSRRFMLFNILIRKVRHILPLNSKQFR